MSPKADGKDWYKQDPPNKRNFVGRGMILHDIHAALFDEDAKEAGGKSAYIRKLWLEDRRRQGLPELPELPGPQPRRKDIDKKEPS